MRAVLAFAGAAWSMVAAGQSLEFTRIEPEPGGVELGWSGLAPGDGVVVEYKELLSDGIWRTPSQLPFPATGSGWVDPTTVEPSRFYRLKRTPLPERGKVLSVTLSSTLSLFQIQLIFSLAQVPITPQYSVRLYRVVYETVTPAGEPITASGALCLPSNVPGPVTLVSYQHGTITEKTDAPSNMDLQSEVSIGVGLATSGFAAVVPDYLGLGASPGLHPYHHARSQATAGVDLLRAALTVAQTNSTAVTNRVFLLGYSQGGHATLALLRELEWFHTNEFQLVASAPMAGAYDLSGTMVEDMLSGRPQPNPYYFLYLLAAYQQVYGLAASLADLLAAPYSSTLPPLLDGTKSGAELNAAMPANQLSILKPEYLAEFRSNPRHPLRLALQENDVFRWRPSTPLRFFHCAGDQDVSKTNSVVAVEYLRSLGLTEVLLVDPLPAANHGDCAQPSMLAALEWFKSFR